MKQKQAKQKNQVSIGTFVRLKPYSVGGDGPSGMDHRLEIHNDFAREGGKMQYNVETVDVEDHGRIIKRDLLHVTVPPDVDPGLVHYNNGAGGIQYEFDKVFDTDASQEHVFDEVVAPKVQDVLSGVNCTVFAYGQTGSGKTFTVSGGNSFDDRGLIPRTIAMVFSELNARQKQKKFQYRCQISYTEVYNEVIYDLLDQDQRATPLDKRSPVQVLESPRGLVLRNLNVFEISSEEDALGLFFMGNSTRLNDATSMNQDSSRSHAIFTILIDTEGMPQPGNQDSYDTDLVVDGKINLVDLAGSERMYKMKNNKEQVKEAKAINLSLHYLEQVILSLRQTDATGGAKKPKHDHHHHHEHVPYRNSVLTNVLRDSLGGNCQSCFILMMSVDRMHFEESISTCRFGQRCGEVKVTIQASVEVSLADQLKEAAKRVRVLESEQRDERQAYARTLAELEHEAEQGMAMYYEQKHELARYKSLHEIGDKDEASQAEDAQRAAGTVDKLFLSAARSITVMKTARNSLIGTLSDGDIAVCRDIERNGLRDIVDASLEAPKGVLMEMVHKLAETAQALFIGKEMLLYEQDKAAAAAATADSADASGKDGIDGATSPAGKGVSVTTESSHHHLVGPHAGGGDAWLQSLQSGYYFLKYDRLGMKSIRFVCVTTDLRSLYWKRINGNPNPTIVSLEEFSRVSLQTVDPNNKDGGKVTLTLHGKPGKRTRKLVVLNAQHDDHVDEVGQFWCDCLNVLLDRNSDLGRAAREAALRRVSSPPGSLVVRLSPFKDQQQQQQQQQQGGGEGGSTQKVKKAAAGGAEGAESERDSAINDDDDL